MLLPQIWGRAAIKEATQTQFLTYFRIPQCVFPSHKGLKPHHHIMIERSVRITMLLTSKKWIKKHFMSC